MSEQMEKCVGGSGVCAICRLQSDSCSSAAMCCFVFKQTCRANIEEKDGLSEKVRKQQTVREKPTYEDTEKKFCLCMCIILP